MGVGEPGVKAVSVRGKRAIIERRAETDEENGSRDDWRSSARVPFEEKDFPASGIALAARQAGVSARVR